ncbi:hypothetical protein BQ8420_12665 [Nocardiopsis sp. JB363]|nr:hypothetical protein BQ8420_12665 [Nocardiopsis sp. JB363]
MLPAGRSEHSFAGGGGAVFGRPDEHRTVGELAGQSGMK